MSRALFAILLCFLAFMVLCNNWAMGRCRMWARLWDSRLHAALLMLHANVFAEFGAVCNNFGATSECDS